MTDETRETLWITDAELIRRIGVPEKIARARLRFLDEKRQYGFPRKDPMWGNRRYWPAVKAYFDRHQGIMVHSDTARNKAHATG